MPDISIIKLKIRRGTDAQRANVVLEQGELGYTTDTRRVFVGDGITQGGIPVSNIFHAPIDYPANLVNERSAVVNDIVYAGSSIYQLVADKYDTIDNWKKIGGNVYTDESTIEYYNSPQGENTLRIKDGGIGPTKFASNAAYNQGGIVASPSNGLLINVDNETINITNTNQLSVNKINEKHISSLSFERGIVGGDGNKISLSVEEDYFGFNSNQLTLTSIPTGVVSFDSIIPGVFGDGIYADGGKYSANVVNSDNDTIINNAGVLSLNQTTSPGDNWFKTVRYNSTGQITESYYAISNTLSGDDSGTNLFNGAPDQISTSTNRTTQTLIKTISSDGVTSVTVTLTSAGFIAFESTASRDGTNVDRFAIPIFTY